MKRMSKTMLTDPRPSFTRLLFNPDHSSMTHSSDRHSLSTKQFMKNCRMDNRPPEKSSNTL